MKYSTHFGIFVASLVLGFVVGVVFDGLRNDELLPSVSNVNIPQLPQVVYKDKIVEKIVPKVEIKTVEKIIEKLVTVCQDNPSTPLAGAPTTITTTSTPTGFVIAIERDLNLGERINLNDRIGNRLDGRLSGRLDSRLSGRLRR